MLRYNRGIIVAATVGNRFDFCEERMHALHTGNPGICNCVFFVFLFFCIDLFLIVFFWFVFVLLLLKNDNLAGD